MTLIECLYEAREIDLIELPHHADRPCQHRLTLAIVDNQNMRATESGMHFLEPHVTCFPFESRGLLFDIWVKWYWCERMKQLTFCWPASLDMNVAKLGMIEDPILHDGYMDMIREYNAQMREAAGIKA